MCVGWEERSKVIIDNSTEQEEEKIDNNSWQLMIEWWSVIISVIQVFIHLNVLSQKHSPDVAIDVSHS